RKPLREPQQQPTAPADDAGTRQARHPSQTPRLPAQAAPGLLVVDWQASSVSLVFEHPDRFPIGKCLGADFGCGLKIKEIEPGLKENDGIRYSGTVNVAGREDLR